MHRTAEGAANTMDRINPWALAITLSLLLLAVPAYQLFATLSLVGNDTEVTRAVAAGLAAPQVRTAVLAFGLGQLVLHLGFAAIIVALARATVRIAPQSAGVNGFVLLWFALGTLTVLGLNALWFPRSESGSYYHALAATPVFGAPAAMAISVLVGTLAAAVALCSAARCLPSVRPGRRSAALMIGIASVILVAYGSRDARGGDARDGGAAESKPHVIVLGIDSLRLGELARNGGRGNTAHLDAFLNEADVFSDVTTPVARTFPSWVAILTGRQPRETGAIFNLVPRERIKASPTLADTLRSHGYRTVLATDEVRFSNIDESYGFDQLITPPIGAADFLLGKLTDLPLTNVVANTWLGGKLFPYTHANRAAAMLFKPRSFVDRLESELDFAGPTLLVAHLCAAHWPYFSAGVPEDADRRVRDDDRPLYDIGLRTADAMFGDIVSILERKGALRNAIVVVLSDHGEGLAVAGDSLLGKTQVDRVAGLQTPVNVMDGGHGQSVLSPVQYSVLLAFRTFGADVAYRATGRTLGTPVTVLDIKPTVLDILGIAQDQSSHYSLSLKPILTAGDPALDARLRDRTRFTETDIRAMTDAAGQVDEKATAEESSFFFAVDRATGRLELRPESMPLLTAFKERAAIRGQMLLAALPADPEHGQYLLVNRFTGFGRILRSAPDPADTEAHILWAQLHAYFRDELLPPTIIGPEQMPEVTHRWTSFISSARTADSQAPGGT